VLFEFSSQNKYYDFEEGTLYWLHRFDTIGFTNHFIIEYSPEFLQYFPDVQPPDNELIRHVNNPKHNLLISFKSSVQ